MKKSKKIKRRATELFSGNSPFKPKIVNSKKIYSRKSKRKGTVSNEKD